MEETPGEYKKTDPDRPTAVTAVCLIGFTGGVLALPMIFSKAAAEVAPWYPFFFAGAVLVSLACLYGIWRMRRWGLNLYIAAHFANQGIMYSADLFSPIGLFVPLLVTVIVLTHYPKMR